ncbi:MAG: family 78 glycoside hydrolase catalytic domain [Candidatus Aminicenantales bacterium]|jgi:alpha-L-rhamnosidase
MTPLPPVDLRCESLAEPLGVDAPKPRFSWLHVSPERDERQTGYSILVSSALELCQKEIGDFWDGGQLQGESSFNVEYQGDPLLSCTRYYWRVRWRDKNGAESPWSEIATFVTGFLYESDWKARWISARNIREFKSRGSVVLGEAGPELAQAFGVYLRREFDLREKPVMALAFVSGLGHGELRINGQKAGDRVLDPGWTDYRRRALYSTFDVTGLLREKNAAGIILGNGRHIRSFGYDAPRATVRIEIEGESGERNVILSDDTWKTSLGPLQENGIYFGEKYDARLEMPGWDEPGFNDSGWEKAVIVPGPPLASQLIPPVRACQRLKPADFYASAPGSWVFDFGQNISGWVRMQVQGPMGTEVRLKHAELVHEDGSVNMGPTENAEATDIYILKGRGLETYEPRFTYHGFRYVELSGYPGEPSADTLEALFVHSDVETAGAFSCSNELINRIHTNVLWGQLSNLMSIPTDCPQRDERHGWLGDAHLSAEEAIYNFDMSGFYAKFLEDIRLAQKEDGSLPDVAPPYLPSLYPADPAWSAAYATLAWLHYEHYEDAKVLARHYPSLRKYIDFLGRNAGGHIIKGLGKYGDWCPPGSIVPKKTPVEFTSTWYYYHDVLLLAKIARVLGRDEEAKEYARLAENILEAFNATFLGDDQYVAIRVSRIDSYPNQTSNVLPLYLDMVPPGKKGKVLESLLRSVVRQQDGHIDTGILGTRYILDVLTRSGQAETAFRMATLKSYPGWGYMIEEGATTLWERWEKLTGPAMNSQNHIMFGSVDAWFYRTIGGLSLLEPGWERFQVKPHILGDLTSAEASLKTVRGPIRAAWKKDESSFDLEVLVPVGSAARVHIPELYKDGLVTESGKVIWTGSRAGETVPGITAAGREERHAVFEVGSGAYRFELTKAG